MKRLYKFDEKILVKGIKPICRVNKHHEDGMVSYYIEGTMIRLIAPENEVSLLLNEPKIND